MSKKSKRRGPSGSMYKVRELEDRDVNWFLKLFNKDILLSDAQEVWNDLSRIKLGIGPVGAGWAFLCYIKIESGWYHISELMSSKKGLGRKLVAAVPRPTIVATADAGLFYQKCGFRSFGYSPTPSGLILEVLIKENRPEGLT